MPEPGWHAVFDSADAPAALAILGLLEEAGYTPRRLERYCGVHGRVAEHLRLNTGPDGRLLQYHDERRLAALLEKESHGVESS